jgi:uncharacterized protein (TIGR00299 family) protein
VGAGKLLFLDAPSGIAGDMTIAALLDLGVPHDAVLEALSALPVKGYHLHVGAREDSGIVATKLDVHVDKKQPERTFGSIRAMLERAKLRPSVRERALRTFEVLARAEARVHRSSIEDVHFHEVGAVDAIVDVVGSAAAFDHLDADVWVSPLPMGRGFVKARHGVLPLPAPATVECLRGLVTYDARLDFELVTPTGAAICAANAAGSSRWPTMTIDRTGWGAGTAKLPDRANLLRAVLGTAPASDDHASPGTHVVLEANLDDATGEIVGACIDAALDAGALDAWAAPVTMKKGRPGLVLSALAPRELSAVVGKAMLAASTSIGLRMTPVTRTERPRRVVTVATRYGDVPVKVAEGDFGPPQMKPEFSACLAAAKVHGVPVREVLREVLVAASDVLIPK